MSWAEIKKAINSNINKSLDVLIIEKCNELQSKLNSVYNTVTVKGNIPSVKSVQRGVSGGTRTGFESGMAYIEVTINSVNMDKSIILTESSRYYQNGSFGSYGIIKNNNIIRIYQTVYDNNTTSIYKVSWQVIEFY